ncbi:MAG TPA: ISL3 family transposase [Ktedonobacterales bacterium]|nr:ISL3 family transposase [Ktedonobacterales bacterium]
MPAAAPYQRRTPILQQRLEAVSFALGGQAGQRLARHLHLGEAGTSRNTLLRLVRRAPLPAASEVAPDLRVVGVDDFAFRRGSHYGAVRVDLDQHRVLDLLPDRDAATFATWLEQHGGAHVAVVSRDRGGAFAEGARQAAPQAVQVADRFHLLQNLGQALDQVLTREHHVLTDVADAVSAAAVGAAKERDTDAERASAPVTVTPEAPAAPRTRLEREHTAVEARRQARYERVVALATAGHSLREVARRAGVNRGTVRRYLRAGRYLSCAQHSRRPHSCAAFAMYLRQRWADGEHNRAALFAELQERGFTGGASTVRQYVRGWRTGPRQLGRRLRQAGAAGAPPPRQRRFSPRQTRWILLRPVEELDPDEQTYRQALCQQSAAIAAAQALVEDFGRIVRARAHTELNGWLAAAARSGLAELVSFARGVQRDYDAVAAALGSPYSQGQTEGQVNRLKLLKRQTYGRANFDLLRRRMLYRAA